MTQAFVYITDTMEFLHCYEDAPNEVAYLRSLHRHLAHYKVSIEVFSDDREIEFIILKHKIKDYMVNLHTDRNCSCEALARMLLSFIQSTYGKDRDIKIEVNEDNENGVELVYRKEN